MLVRVPELPVRARGWIPLIAGAAMTRAVMGQLRGTGHSAGLKWPNDVLLDGGKVSGIVDARTATKEEIGLLMTKV